MSSSLEQVISQSSDLPNLIALAGEVGAMDGDLQGKRLHVLTRLAKITNADKGVVTELKRNKRTGQWIPVQDTVQFFSTPDVEQIRILKYFSTCEPIDPVLENMTKLPANIVVGRATDFLADRDWRVCPHFQLVCKPANALEKLRTFVRAGGSACLLDLHRRTPTPFSRQEVMLVEAFMQGAGRLLLPGETFRIATDGQATGVKSLNTPVTIALPPRLGSVLERFLLGESEKEAAHYLGVTHHTVHSYAKQLYRRLGVSSRSELLARFIQSSKPLHSMTSNGVTTDGRRTL